MKIYVASSWRNGLQPNVVRVLRDKGHEVYDFRQPTENDSGFHWSEIDPKWQSWSPEQYRNGLKNPLAETGFKSDLDAMKWADVFVGVMPFGRSASFEMGWGAGHGKKTVLLLESGEPELMAKMFDYICCDLFEALEVLDKIEEEVLSNDSVRAFGDRMLYKLDKNVNKPCATMNPDETYRKWDHCSAGWLLKRLKDETEELEDALSNLEIGPIDSDYENVMSEAADVANFAMMIFDNIKSRDL